MTDDFARELRDKANDHFEDNGVELDDGLLVLLRAAAQRIEDLERNEQDLREDAAIADARHLRAQTDASDAEDRTEQLRAALSTCMCGLAGFASPDTTLGFMPQVGCWKCDDAVAHTKHTAPPIALLASPDTTEKKS